MSAAWAYSALFRGLLAGARDTTMLAVSGMTRIAVAAIIVSTTLYFVSANAVIIGLAGWMAGYAVEAALLAIQLKRMDRKNMGARLPRLNDH
jgi:hypothetical protein